MYYDIKNIIRNLIRVPNFYINRTQELNANIVQSTNTVQVNKKTKKTQLSGKKRTKINPYYEEGDDDDTIYLKIKKIARHEE